jgi:large subunit ribosomal protein L19
VLSYLPVNLPALQKVEINKKGAVRRARIFYLENLLVKAKIKDKRR